VSLNHTVGNELSMFLQVDHQTKIRNIR
jgi:hypothetical protein